MYGDTGVFGLALRESAIFHLLGVIEFRPDVSVAPVVVAVLAMSAGLTLIGVPVPKGRSEVSADFSSSSESSV